MCKVSIIIPVYNGEKVLRRCLDSVLAQDHKDLEAIVVDDGSKDSSWPIIEEYAQKDPRIIAIHKDNSGVSATRNLALKKARGEYIQFMDVDDWLPFDSTKLLVRTIEEDATDLVVADFYRVIEDNVSKKGSIRKSGVLSIGEFADKMLVKPADFYYGALWNKLYRKKIIDEYDLHMPEDISFSEDTIFNLQYLSHVKEISVLKSPVYYYVKTEGSLVAKNLNIQSAVKMKTSVISYYDAFYKQIMDKDEYEAKKPIIYGFLLAVSTDALALPLIEDTRKLEEESETNDNIAIELQFDRLSEKVFDRLLKTLAMSESLELNDVKVLYYLYKKGKEGTGEEIAAACRLNGPQTALTLTKLAASGSLRISNILPFTEDKLAYSYINSDLDNKFDRVEEDFRSLCYDGLDVEEIADYIKVKKQIFNNLRKIGRQK